MSWSSRRQIIILGAILLIVIVVSGFFAAPIIFKEPTCSDQKQNGEEAGIDCGGSCQKICTTQVNELKSLWARSFKVAEGVYDALAYVENQNFDAGIKEILYKFSLYDADNILIETRVGKTYITPNGKIPVFESTIRTGSRVPRRTFFEFAATPEWVKIPEKALPIPFSTSAIKFEEFSENGRPRLSATIHNKGTENLRDVEVTALLYDAKDNALGVSRTYIDLFPRGTSHDVVFTWLMPLSEKPTKIDVVSRVKSF